jgi:hypothetical protein
MMMNMNNARGNEPAAFERAPDVDAFNKSLSGNAPPSGLSPVLSALWWEKKGDWDVAHRIVMDDDGRDAAWVHAYLHRVEGDLGNAAYWYRRAGRPAHKGALDAEWTAMVAGLLGGAR